MKKIIKIMDKIMGWISTISIAGFTTLTFVQVVCRYILKVSFHWNEEICMYMLILVVLCGSITSIRGNGHIAVDFINDVLKDTGKFIVSIIVYVLMLVCCIYFTYSGIQLVLNIGNRLSGELLIPMRYVYTVLPVSGGLMCLYTVFAMYDFIANKKKNKKEGEK